MVAYTGPENLPYRIVQPPAGAESLSAGKWYPIPPHQFSVYLVPYLPGPHLPDPRYMRSLERVAWVHPQLPGAPRALHHRLNTPIPSSPRMAPARRRDAQETHPVQITQSAQPIHHITRLGEQWQSMPSDHLPIAFDVAPDCCVGSWNVLNRDFIDLWMNQRDTQGLRGSSITTQCELELVGGTVLITSREKLVVEFIKSMLTHPIKPRALIALQECGDFFLQYLELQLRETSFRVIKEENSSGNQVAFIYDSSVLKLISCNMDKIFPKESKKSILNGVFEQDKTGKKFRFINVHLPGDPECVAARQCFAQYLAGYARPDRSPMIALGDMNFTAEELQPMLTDAASCHGVDFQVFVPPYPTNIGIQVESPRGVIYPVKSVDLVITTRPDPQAKMMKPSEVLGPEMESAMEETLQLIERVRIS